ncbi:UDP-N-acetylmuramoyl-L-alanyl-D-glutamate--2,6-diaminopimelate ligase [Ureibacillus sp. 179-F W5.1 NHS]|uniref:UDP-N-acetylmuramoyl-L-alanyl-D-glutamate--2,6-diaminopimelate ligase n=1 Tax=Lysinibacillus halotolerans TaxID=1368476 RepID=A0A3M8HGG4_9BACI|nr:UDP-N-acetylmuramoyl-L-alanyl-D-glutamate--2,6-diaminopimelate ligase [Lysinibacillus halotolerans]RND01598.1 UDP-N-acetylmuramoyl-L-alanyl-D-glutamate--2,6-diaminopimelate ligase [Lysinibacillus halotolerans]
MQLAELLKEWPCTVKGGSIRVEVTGIEDYAQGVKKGDLFIVRKGRKSDGLKYVDTAIENGAVGIVIEDEKQLDTLKLSVPVIWVPNVLKFMSYSAAKLNHFPAEAMQVIAITGTNGKTTVSHFIGQLLHALHKNVIVIGTNGIYINGVELLLDYEHLTTLQPKHLHRILKIAVSRGVEYVVLEASSMGLAKHRLDDCAINIGVFLNLAEDHIEDHGSYDKYKAAKQILSTLSERLVLNGDDSFCRTVGLQAKKKKAYFGLGNRVDYQLQLLAEGVTTSTCCLQSNKGQKVFSVPFVGEHHLQNTIAAITSVSELGFPIADICEAAEKLTLPKGRLEAIPNDFNLDIYIDYAHTEAALRAVLQTLNKTVKRDLIVVFSCGGDRDKHKRIKMGAVASKYANFIYLTTDNPRSEDPELINSQIAAGFSPKQQYEMILDRAKAIETAILNAKEGDTILIAGKGHETTQTIGTKEIQFSDYECVKAVLEKRLTDHVE